MNTDKPLGLGLIAFAIAGIAVTMQITVRTFNDDPGPQLFPLIGFGLLILCGIGIFFTRSPAQSEADDPAEARNRLVRGGQMSGLFIAYSVGLWQLGFHITTPLMVYAFYHVIAGPGRRTPWKGAVYALCVTGATHLVFTNLLNSLLPTGALF